MPGRKSTGRDAKPSPTSRSWWLTGDETCGCCAQRYSYHTVYFCIACDRPFCAHCVSVNELREVLCPECGEELEE